MTISMSISIFALIVSLWAFWYVRKNAISNIANTELRINEIITKTKQEFAQASEIFFFLKLTSAI